MTKFPVSISLERPSLCNKSARANGKKTRDYPRKTEISRAIAAAKSCGMEVTGIEVAPDGSIKILGGAGASTQSEFDTWEKAGRL